MKLRAETLVKKYKKRTVVKGVSIEVSQGEIVGLLGPNGAGKTTSFYMIVGLIKPNEGEIFLDDKRITSEAMFRRAKMGIGYLPQEASVFRKLSVEDNIMAVLEMTKLSRSERKKRLNELIDEFGLDHVRTNRGDLLSGGERRRTEIARALAVDPSFVLLDEPFAGVDPIAVEDIQTIVSKLKKKNIGVLITDHNVQETLSITDRAYLLFEGNILQAGTAEQLAADEEVREKYLGRNFTLRKTGANRLEGVLENYEQFELAAMYHYRYPNMEDETKAAVDGFLKKKFLTPAILDSVFQEMKQSEIVPQGSYCRRCKSKKLMRVEEESTGPNVHAKKAVVSAIKSPKASQEVAEILDEKTKVYKTSCQVCGDTWIED